MLLRCFSNLSSSRLDGNKISFYIFAWITEFQHWNFVLVGNVTLAPRNEFASSNFVGSPYSHTFLTILKVVDKARTIPFHWLFDGRQRRPSQHCFYSRDTSKWFYCLLHLRFRLYIVAWIQIDGHMGFNRCSFPIARSLPSLGILFYQTSLFGSPWIFLVDISWPSLRPVRQ